MPSPELPKIRREDVPLLAGVGGAMLWMLAPELKNWGILLIGLALGTFLAVPKR